MLTRSAYYARFGARSYQLVARGLDMISARLETLRLYENGRVDSIQCAFAHRHVPKAIAYRSTERIE